MYILVKLIHLNCPLRVIIGYNNADNRDKDMDKLNFALDAIQRIEAYESMSGEILIILGNCGKGYKNFDYRGYVFSRNTEEKGFEIID